MCKPFISFSTLESWFAEDFPDTSICPHKSDYCSICFSINQSLVSVQQKILLNKVNTQQMDFATVPLLCCTALPQGFSRLMLLQRLCLKSILELIFVQYLNKFQIVTYLLLICFTHRDTTRVRNFQALKVCRKIWSVPGTPICFQQIKLWKY